MKDSITGRKLKEFMLWGRVISLIPYGFRKKPKFHLRKAELLFNKSKRFKKDGIWEGKDEEYFTLPVVRIRHGIRFYSGTRRKKEKRFLIKNWLKSFVNSYMNKLKQKNN